MNRFDFHGFLRNWQIHYNESEHDINKEAENCVTIRFSEDDIRLLTTEDLKNVITDAVEFIKMKNIQKVMIFYAWVDEMIPAIRFGLVSKIYNKLPFSCDYIEIKDKDEAANYFFERLRFVEGPIKMDDLKQCSEDDKCLDFDIQKQLKIYSRDVAPSTYN